MYVRVLKFMYVLYVQYLQHYIERDVHASDFVDVASDSLLWNNVYVCMYV